MSFRELAVTIAAYNEASAEFTKVSSDAARMASEVAAHPVTIQVENLAGAEINRVAEDVARVKSEIESSPVRLEFEPVEMPPIPPIEVPPIEVPPIPPVDVSQIREVSVAFGEAGFAAVEMGENVRASASGLVEVQTQAEATTVSLRTVATTLTTMAGLSTAVISLAGDLGLVDKESAKWARTILSIITITSSWIRLKSYLTTITAGHTAAVALNTTTQSANASASIASAVAYKIHAAASWVATTAQNALNISYGTFLALTGVGIGVIIAAAAAMWTFANSMNSATASVKEYNATVAETPTRTRSIIRAGEEEMYRRGVE
jgi:hypothetical protein